MKSKKTIREIWKKVEHWIVIAIVTIYFLWAIANVFFAKELGLARDRYSEYDDKPQECSSIHRYDPC